MKKWYFKNQQIIKQELLYASFCLLILFVFLEIIFPNIVLVYFNLNYLFALVIIFGLLTLVRYK
mgnify:CR=1 FL=1